MIFLILKKVMEIHPATHFFGLTVGDIRIRTYDEDGD